MTRLIPRVALAAAAALALSLASPVAAPAQASPAAPAAMAPAATSPVQITGLRLHRSDSSKHRLSGSSTITSTVSLNVAKPTGFRVRTVTADVYVRGRAKGSVELPWYSTTKRYLEWPRGYGAGVTQLRNVVVTGSYPESLGTTHRFALPTVSNKITVRRTREVSSVSVLRMGPKKIVTFRGFRAHNARGRLVPTGKARLQYKVGKKWKTAKRVKIRASGKTRVTVFHPRKYRYRLLIKGTKTVEGIKEMNTHRI